MTFRTWEIHFSVSATSRSLRIPKSGVTVEDVRSTREELGTEDFFGLRYLDNKDKRTVCKR